MQFNAGGEANNVIVIEDEGTPVDGEGTPDDEGTPVDEEEGDHSQSGVGIVVLLY